MNSNHKLHIDWCSHEAATFAVMNWHYSKRMPVGKIVKVGAWEEGEFIGAVLFARGNTPTLGNAYGLTQNEVCELVRVALRKHETPVSRILSIALRFLAKQSPGLRLVVSFADPEQGHHGGIYQAGNWAYTGDTEPATAWFYKGRWVHNREITAGAFGSNRGAIPNYKQLPSKELKPKHRYLYPLDSDMRRQIAPLAKPYPKRQPAPEASSDAPAKPGGRGRGSTDPGALRHA